MDVILVEPVFPTNQREFARALHAVGARVIGIGERPKAALDPALRRWLAHYEQVSNVCDEGALEAKVRWVMGRADVQRLEATVEAHIMSAARVRERCGIPGTSVRTAFLCRDKPAMKEALRARGHPLCAVHRRHPPPRSSRAFARRGGLSRSSSSPAMPPAPAGTVQAWTAPSALEARPSARLRLRSRRVRWRWRSSSRATRASTTPSPSTARSMHEFVSHYYPGVLEAMRTRWISPQFIATNRVDGTPGYQEVKEMGLQGHRDLLGIDHLRYPHGVVLRPEGP